MRCSPPLTARSADGVAASNRHVAEAGPPAVVLRTGRRSLRPTCPGGLFRLEGRLVCASPRFPGASRMTDENWNRLRTLFERAALIDEGRVSEPGLKDRLRALLEADDSAGALLAEREALAAGTTFDHDRLMAPMDHPGIAQLFDADVAPGGRPYVAMEHVTGASITTFCDQERRPLRERRNLFHGACDAVQHAHQKGLIHGDIEPPNVMVSRKGGAAALKVIDCGIVKATGESALDERTMARECAVFGTIGDMGPEQLGVISAPVDARTDIYRLGVLLCELLARGEPVRPGPPQGRCVRGRGAHDLGGGAATSLFAGGPIRFGRGGLASIHESPAVVEATEGRTRVDRAAGSREGTGPPLRLGLGTGRRCASLSGRRTGPGRGRSTRPRWPVSTTSWPTPAAWPRSGTACSRRPRRRSSA